MGGVASGREAAQRQQLAGLSPRSAGTGVVLLAGLGGGREPAAGERRPSSAAAHGLVDSLDSSVLARPWASRATGWVTARPGLASLAPT